MPEKLERCVRDVKAKGMSDDSAWGICVDSTGEKPHKENTQKESNTNLPFFNKSNKTKESQIQEKVNANRQVPVSNPPIKKGKIEPDIKKTPKDVGGKRLNQDSILWKDIFDSQLKRNVKEPKL